jgi:small subunit ribosomal protein S18
MLEQDNNPNEEINTNLVSSMYENAYKKLFFRKERKCPLEGVKIDYKDVKLLSRFVSEGGRMLPSRITSVSQSKQRSLKLAIRRARILALMPFVKN